MKNETWVVTDGRAGMINQARGLADAIGLPVSIRTVHPRLPWTLLPVTLWPAPRRALGPDSDNLDPPWPRLMIGCGWRSTPYLIEARRLSAGSTFTVALQDPRVSARHFDLVVPPEHDQLTGPNVIPIIGSPNGITASRLAKARHHWESRFASLPSPRIAVLVGGKSKSHSFGHEEAGRLAAQLAGLTSQGYGLMVTTSRRTGEEQSRIIRDALQGSSAFVWDGSGENPYLGFLAVADAILVTSDSTNMAVEAAATGKPVHVIDLPCNSGKFTRLHARLRELGISRPFTGEIGTWTYPPLEETRRVAEIIRGKLGLSSTTAPA